VPKNNAAAEQDFLNGIDEVNVHTERKSAMDFVGEVSDGLETVHKVEELRQESILLGIGIPASKLPGKFTSLHASLKSSF
jgi:hypothetical protein